MVSYNASALLQNCWPTYRTNGFPVTSYYAISLESIKIIGKNSSTYEEGRNDKWPHVVFVDFLDSERRVDGSVAGFSMFFSVL